MITQEIKIKNYNRILVPIDSTKQDLSKRLVDRALTIAQLENQNKELQIQRPIIIVINVLDDVKQGGAIGLQAKYGNVNLVKAYANVRENIAKKWLIPVETEARNKGYTILSKIIHAHGKSIATVIADYVNENNIDLIIIGAGDLFKLKYLLVGGSITGRIIKKCNCPILLVR